MYMIIKTVEDKHEIMVTVKNMDAVFRCIRKEHEACSNFNVAFLEEKMYIESSDYDEQDDFFYIVYHCIEY